MHQSHVAGALSQLAESTDRIIALQKAKPNNLEKAITLVEADGWEKEEVIQAADVFLDERKATIFCTLSPPMRRAWLRKQIVAETL